LFVEAFAETRDRRSGKLPAAEFGGDLLDATRGDALSRSHEIYVHHLHQRKDQCLQTDTSVATSGTGQREKFETSPRGRGAPLAQESLRERADAGGELPRIRAVPVALAAIGLFVGRGPQVVGHLRIQNLV